MGKFKAHLMIFSLVILLLEMPVTIAYSQSISEAQQLCGEADHLRDIGKHDDALKKYSKGMSICIKLNDLRNTAIFMIRIGMVLTDTGDHEKALGWFHGALECARTIKDEVFESLILFKIGITYEIDKKYEKSLEYLQNALTIFRKTNDKVGEADTLSQLGKGYFHVYNNEKALRCYLDSLMIFRELGNRKGEAQQLYLLGVLYEDLRIVEKSCDYLTAALKLFKECGDKQGEADSLRDLGKSHIYGNDYSKAISLLDRSLAICREIGYRPGEADSLLSISICYKALGDYGIASEYSFRALEISRKIADKDVEATALNNLSQIFVRLGNYRKALEYARNALRLSKDTGARNVELACLSTIGAIYESLREYDTAIENQMEALKVAQDIASKVGQADALNNIGNICLAQKKYKEAIENYLKSSDIAAETGNRQCAGANLNNIALAFMRAGDHKMAEGLFTKSLKVAEAREDQELLLCSLLGLGVTYFQLNDYEKSFDYLEKSAHAVEKLRDAARLEEYKMMFMGNKVFVYDMLVFLSMKKGKDEDVFHYAEKAQARAFLDLLGNRKIHFNEKASPELIGKEEHLDADITALRGRMQVEKDELKLKNLAKELKSLQKEYEETLLQLKLSNPEYVSLKSVQISSLKEIQSALKEDSAILEYFITDDAGYLLVIEKNAFRAIKLSQNGKGISDNVRKLRQKIVTKEECREIIAALSEVLIKPAEGMINDKKKLVIVPHGVLHYVPFSLLYRSDGEYSVKKHQITVAPSASVWKLCLDKRPGTARHLAAYALGNETGDFLKQGEESFRELSTDREQDTRSSFSPLPATKNEVEGIGKLFRDKTLIIGRDLTWKKVKATIKNGNYIHFATHGLLDPYSPVFSGLLLSDRLMDVADIYSMDLQARLVVLSACNTAIGNFSRGDEIVALSRAFMYAGTPTVVASLWSVSDEATSVLMKYFYDGITGGKGEAQAMREAQLKQMEKYPHPFYWAPFIVIGETQG